MIVIDFNQTAISNLMAEVGGRKDIDIDVPLLRHMILNSIRGYNQKFGAKYGEMVIACDNRNYWRRQEFQYYKAGRKKAREESGLDWKLIFEALTMIREELHTYFPYKVIDIDGAEADDVIAVLAEWSQSNDTETLLFTEPKPFLILSGDHDFIQLQKWKNVHQYSPIQKKFIKPDISPEQYIFEHIIKGDKGDGIPNVLSADDSIVTGTRQKSIMQKKMDIWFKDKDQMPQDIEFAKNYERNKMLVSFDHIPVPVKENIIHSYVGQPNKDKSKLLNFFIQNKMKNMMELIEEF
jgi:5'-3' exonuclease